jgi:protein involved in polysaccharide export with SLBB domain
VLTATVPHAVIVVPPSVNATVPPSGTGDTVAVYVTGAPSAEGFAEDCKPVEVPVVPTAWSSVDDGELPKFVSPE